MENLCCAYGEGSLSPSHTSFSSPVLPGAFLVLVELGFCCPQAHTTSKLCECASVRGRGSPWPPRSCALCCLSGAVVSLSVVEEEEGESALSLADEDGIDQPEPWESVLPTSCSGTKVKIKAHPVQSWRPPAPPPSQRRGAPFKLIPKLCLHGWEMQ